MRTVEEEFFGRVLDLGDPGATPFKLPLSVGQGGAQTFKFSLTSVTRTAILPLVDLTGGVAPYMPSGGEPAFILVNVGGSAGTLNVIDGFGIPVVSIPTGKVAEIYLLSSVGSFFGVWSYRLLDAAVGSSLPNDRIAFDIEIPGTTVGIDLYRILTAEYGYDGFSAVAIRARILGDIGNQTTSQATFYATGFPTGSLLTLTVNPGVGIYGRGGEGGYGGFPSILAGPGEAGGDAMFLGINTNIYNYGIIGGGGGGGGGGAVVSGTGGGGGGGGAGFVSGKGGRGGPPGGGDGAKGQLLYGGAGGAAPSNGGGGGSAGAAGSPGSGGGGAAGRSIVRLAANTVTKVVVGTILGSEVAV